MVTGGRNGLRIHEKTLSSLLTLRMDPFCTECFRSYIHLIPLLRIVHIIKPRGRCWTLTLRARKAMSTVRHYTHFAFGSQSKLSHYRLNCRNRGNQTRFSLLDIRVVRHNIHLESRRRGLRTSRTNRVCRNIRGTTSINCAEQAESCDASTRLNHVIKDAQYFFFAVFLTAHPNHVDITMADFTIFSGYVSL